jgi:hypothetical protein
MSLKGSQFDVWVQRISHMSQLGLLILATFGYFYTVRPIYTKSILEEEIAKKQLEMKEKDNKLIESNKLISLKQQELRKTSDQADSAAHQLAYAKNSLDKASQELALVQKQLYDRNNDLFNAKKDLDKSKSASTKYYSELKINVVNNVLWSNKDCAKTSFDLFNPKFSYNRIGKCINEISAISEILNALEPKDKQHFLTLVSSVDKMTGIEIDKIQSEYDTFYKAYKIREIEKDKKLSGLTLNSEDRQNVIRSSIDEHFDMDKKLSDKYHKVIKDAFSKIESQFLEH